MRLVVDANIIFSAMIGYNSKIVDLFFRNDLELIAPEYMMEEIEEHREEVIEKTGYTKEDFNVIISLLYSTITFAPFGEFQKYIAKAKEVCPDEDDLEYVALALCFECSIWSNDKALTKQKEIKILSSHELITTLEKDRDEQSETNY